MWVSRNTIYKCVPKSHNKQIKLFKESPAALYKSGKGLVPSHRLPQFKSSHHQSLDDRNKIKLFGLPVTMPQIILISQEEETEGICSYSSFYKINPITRKGHGNLSYGNIRWVLCPLLMSNGCSAAVAQRTSQSFLYIISIHILHIQNFTL